MAKFMIEGGKELSGDIKVQGAKNAVLPLLAACLLTDEDVTLKNVPDLIDVDNMLKILVDIGVSVTKGEHTVKIEASQVNSCCISPKIAKELRSSIFMLGAVLSRKGFAKITYPGGCDIGLRPIDIHIKALTDLGVEVEETSGCIFCDGSNMRSGNVYLDYPSVGATENLILSSTLLDGATVIYNSAREPEIVDLARFLNAMGAKIKGAGSSKIVIEGVKRLHACEYSVMPDRIVAQTYMMACLCCGGEIRFVDASPIDIQSLFYKLPKNSCIVNYKDDIISIKSKGRLKAVERISTQPYPGFPTDLQAPFMTLMCIGKGTCVLTENIFENRFRHVPELRRMGADIIIKDRTAVIKGVESLHGAEVYAQDLRGGAALVLAGLCAEGITVVNDVYHIDRGYESPEKVLSNIGANIVRV